MAKLTLTDGTVFEGTTEELIALTEKFSGKVADPVAGNITHNGVEYTIVDRKAQEGDVVILQDTGGDLFKVGKVYEVLEDVLIADSDGDLFELYRPSLRRTTETVLVYEPKAEPLEVGDYAVLISASYRTLHGFSDGEIVEVIQNKYGGDDDDYRVKKITGEHSGYVKKSAEFVRKATDTEVAEAKASAELNAVFTHAGRKPNEYRKGDIVVVTGESSGEKFYGEIGGKNEAYIDNRYYFTQFGRSYCNTDKADDMTIITFAESRLDLRK